MDFLKQLISPIIPDILAAQNIYLSTMSFSAKAQVKISKPTEEVFDAVVNSEKLCKYFTSTASASMTEGATLTWCWADVGAEGTVFVEEVEANRSIVFQWPATAPNRTVELTFESLPDGGTRISAKESGDWSFNLSMNSVEEACGQTGGWVHMFLCLKAYLEYGINLTQGSV